MRKDRISSLYPPSQAVSCLLRSEKDEKTVKKQNFHHSKSWNINLPEKLPLFLLISLWCPSNFYTLFLACYTLIFQAFRSWCEEENFSFEFERRIKSSVENLMHALPPCFCLFINAENPKAAPKMFKRLRIIHSWIFWLCYYTSYTLHQWRNERWACSSRHDQINNMEKLDSFNFDTHSSCLLLHIVESRDRHDDFVTKLWETRRQILVKWRWME